MITINQEIESYSQEVESYFNTETGKKSFRNYIDNKEIFLFFKRSFDIILSAAVIMFLLSWIIPVMAIAIKLNSRGPVFFIQRRVGRGLKSFGCIKFRTMVPNNESDKYIACEKDNRVTTLGKFLRYTRPHNVSKLIILNVFGKSITICEHVGSRAHINPSP